MTEIDNKVILKIVVDKSIPLLKNAFEKSGASKKQLEETEQALICIYRVSNDITKGIENIKIEKCADGSK